MTMPKASHTPGLLHVENHDDYGTQAEREICRIEGVGYALKVCTDRPKGFYAWPAVMRANAARLVACWNALDGIAEPSHLAEVLKRAGELAAVCHFSPCDGSQIDARNKLEAALARLEKGRE